MTVSATEKKLVGYPSRLCVQPGESVELMVHSHAEEHFEADLVRIIHGEVGSKTGPGLIVEKVESSFEGRHRGVQQDLRIGSFFQANLGAAPPVPALTFAVALFPTLVLERDQTIAELAKKDGSPVACLRLCSQGRLELEMGGSRRKLDLPIPLHRWSFVGFSLAKDQVRLFKILSPRGRVTVPRAQSRKGRGISTRRGRWSSPR